MQSGDGFEAAKGLAGMVTTCVEAVTRDVAALGDLPPGCEAIVASAVALARELDDDNSATSKSMCARALREAMDRLRDLAPPKAKADRLDDLTARRQKRQTQKKRAS